MNSQDSQDLDIAQHKNNQLDDMSYMRGWREILPEQIPVFYEIQVLYLVDHVTIFHPQQNDRLCNLFPLESDEGCCDIERMLCL